MATKLTKRDIDPEKVYVAWTTGFAAMPDGSEAAFVRGKERRGSEAIVQARPELFVPVGTPPTEWPSEWSHVINQDVATDAAYRAEQARNAPPEIPADKQVVATATFRAGGRSFAEGTSMTCATRSCGRTRTSSHGRRGRSHDRR